MFVALGDSFTEGVGDRDERLPNGVRGWAARASGASALRTNVNIVLPLLRSTIGGAGALMFVLLTHEFAASLLVRAPTTQVMGTVLFDFYTNGSYPLVAAIALVMTVVTAIGVTFAVLIGGSDALGKL